MARPPNPYTRLPGRGLRKSAFAVTATRCRLWLASDHLLALESTVASEEYRRFFFRDIEALVIRKTAGRLIWNWLFFLLGFLTTAPLLYGWRQSGDGGFVVGAIACAILWSALMLYNTLRGAACVTSIRTFVQLEELPSLGRLPVARRVLARIRPLIEAAQGGLTAEEVNEAPWRTDSISVNRPGALDLQPELPDKGHFHAALAAAMIVESALGFLYFVRQTDFFATLNILATLAGFLACVVALIRQRDRIVSAGLRLFARLALGYYVLGFVAGIVFGMIYAIRHEGRSAQTGLEFIGEPGFAETMVASSILAALLACYGLAQWLLQSRRAGHEN